MQCFGSGEAGHKLSYCPKVEWNKGKSVQGARPRNPQPATSQGRPPAAAPGHRNTNFKKPQDGGRVYYLKARQEEETQDPHAVVSGTLLVNHLFTRVLFDTGTTHSFINPETAKRLACELEEMDVQLCVAIPVGSIYQTKAVVRNCPITIHDEVFLADLVLLEIQGYDVILRMDWLAKHKAIINCQRKLLTLATPEGEKLVYKGTHHKQATPII